MNWFPEAQRGRDLLQITARLQPSLAGNLPWCSRVSSAEPLHSPNLRGHSFPSFDPEVSLFFFFPTMEGVSPPLPKNMSHCP